MKRLIHGDCLEAMDLLIEEGVKFDAIISDPTFGTTRRKNDIVLPLELMWDKLLKLRRNKHTPIVLFSNGIYTARLMLSNEKMWKYNWVWNKVLVSGMLNANKMPMTDYDHITVFYEKPCLYNKQMKQGKPEHGRGNVDGKGLSGDENNYNAYDYVSGNKGNTLKNPTRIITIPKDHPSKVIHSQQKPIELGEYMVKTYTNEGDTVLDFMMGSGFIPIACEKHSRGYVGVDNGQCDKKRSEYYGKPWDEVVKDRIKKSA